ncbi:MAG: hypothetical protein WA160_06745 [Pseudobdellovibrio sp.]
MLGKIISRSVLLVISTACVANAYIVPGEPGQLPGYQEPLPGYQQPDNGGNSGPGYQPPPPPPSHSNNPYEPANPYEPNPYEPNPNQPSYGSEVKTIYIGRSVRNERLPLRELAGLNSSFNGSEVLSVRGSVRPDISGRTVVQLVADGRVIATQSSPNYQINLMPNMRVLLGQTVRSLQLVVSGSLIINDLQIEISRNGGGGYNPQPPPPYYGHQRVDLNIYRATIGNDRIDLTQYINLSAYRGYAIEQVIISGSAQYGSSFVSLLVNSFNMGQVQFSNGYSQSQSMYLNQRPIIGQGADSLVLYTQGNMTVDHVTLVLSN